jgi:hypothetical protein
MGSQSSKTLGAIVYPDFELLDLYGPQEMFGSLGDACNIITVSDPPGLVASSQGPKTHAESAYADCPPLDLVLLTGGLGLAGATGKCRSYRLLAVVLSERRVHHVGVFRFRDSRQGGIARRAPCHQQQAVVPVGDDAERQGRLGGAGALG